MAACPEWRLPGQTNIRHQIAPPTRIRADDPDHRPHPAWGGLRWYRSNSWRVISPAPQMLLLLGLVGAV